MWPLNGKTKRLHAFIDALKHFNYATGIYKGQRHVLYLVSDGVHFGTMAVPLNSGFKLFIEDINTARVFNPVWLDKLTELTFHGHHTPARTIALPRNAQVTITPRNEERNRFEEFIISCRRLSPGLGIPLKIYIDPTTFYITSESANGTFFVVTPGNGGPNIAVPWKVFDLLGPLSYDEQDVHKVQPSVENKRVQSIVVSRDKHKYCISRHQKGFDDILRVDYFDLTIELPVDNLQPQLHDVGELIIEAINDFYQFTDTWIHVNIGSILVKYGNRCYRLDEPYTHPEGHIAVFLDAEKRLAATPFRYTGLNSVLTTHEAVDAHLKTQNP